MYLTAQRVKSANKVKGINAALYLHGKNREHSMWTSLDLQSIIKNNPGKQKSVKIEIPPGGNLVECYLDIVAPDDIKKDELMTALTKFEGKLKGTLVQARFSNIAIEFSLNLSDEQNLSSWFHLLESEVMNLFNNPHHKPQVKSNPIVVDLKRAQTELVFRLNSASFSKLIKMYGKSITKGNLRVPFDTEQDFSEIYGSLYPYVAEILTNQSLNELIELGGVCIQENGKTVWTWPASSVD